MRARSEHLLARPFCRHNKADQQILKNIKNAVDARSSVTHGATVAANALMHAGEPARDSMRPTRMRSAAPHTRWAAPHAQQGRLIE